MKPVTVSWIKIISIYAVLAFTPATHAEKIRSHDTAATQRLIADGGKLVADYGTFQVVEATALAMAKEQGKVESVDTENFIELHAGAVDTRTSATKSLRKARGSFRGKGLHLVQFAAPVKPEWRAELVATGVKIIAYIPQNTFLVYGDAAALAAAQTWAGTNAVVQWEGTYADDWKVNPTARLTNALGQAHWPGTAFAIQLVDDSFANSNTLAQVDTLKLAPIERESRTLGYRNVFVELPPEKLAELATNADVVSIQPYFPRKKFCERQAQIMAGNISGNSPSGPGYLAWLTGKGFTQAQFDASGFVVDVTDSGIDNGTTSPNHFGLHLGGTNTLASRVAYNRLEGTPNPGSTLQGCDGHGNLNAHIIGGYDDLTGFPFADGSGFHYGLGICPFVRVGSSVIFDVTNFTSPNYDNLASRAYNNGARVSNNSWGADTAGAYDADAQNYDALVRDAQPSGSAVPNAGNQEMVFVFAAGNAGSGASTVGSPGTGKNIICVGAAENVQPFGGSDASGVADTGADSANDVISFSSRGPCSDGRFKPDLCAPGTHVSGGVAQAANPSATGTAIACFDGTGVSGGTGGSSYFPSSGQQFYTASSGTSHSTPGIAGACALLRQYFINQSLTPPSPAMTKAYLVNSTRYMTGTGASGTLPSNSQGLGSVNLGTAFDGVNRVIRDQLSVDKFTASGQARTNTGFISTNSKPFRVTLAWTDAPGNTTGNAYNNNLDLNVIVGSVTYKGNVFSGSNSVSGGANDAKNNLECVFVPAGVSGPFIVTVNATSINSDGVPNESPTIDQDFALVIYNATNAAIPPIILTQPQNRASLPGGSATFTIGVTGDGPLSYQWYFNSNAIAGATATSFSIANVDPTNAGTYTVVISNLVGSVTSSPAILSIANSAAYGGILVAWEMSGLTGGSGNYGPSPFAAVSNAPNVTVSGLTRGTGVNTSSTGAGNAWGGSGFTSSSEAASITANTFATFSVTGNVGYVVSFTNIAAYNIRRSSTGSTTGMWQYQIGGGTFTDIGSAIAWGSTTSSSGNLQSAIDLTGITALQNVPAGTNVTFRIVPWGGTSSSGSWYINNISAGFDLQISGALSPANGVQSAPVIVQQPASTNILQGGNAAFAVTANGSGPLLYKWSKNSAPITAATNATLTLTNVSMFNAGNYSVVISNLYGFTNSSVVVLTVTNVFGLPVDNGPGFLNDENLYTTNISGGVCFVWSTADVSQPVSAWTLEGSTVEFPIVGTGISRYGITVKPATSPVYYIFTQTNTGPYTASEPLARLSTADFTAFEVLVTNVPINAAGVFALLSPPVITVQPLNTNVFVGNNAAFSVTATGNAPLNYQWLKAGVPVANGGAISGARTNVLTFIPAATNHTGNYSVIVTNLGGSVTSSLAALNVVPVPSLVLSNSGAGFVLAAGSGAVSNRYIVQRTTNLSPPIVWVPLVTNIIGTNGIIQFNETSTAAPFQFYRVAFP